MSFILLKLPKDNKRFNPFPGVGGILVGTAIRDFLAGISANTFHYYFHSRTKSDEWNRTTKYITGELGFMKREQEYGTRAITYVGNEGTIIIEKVRNNSFYPEILIDNVMFTIDQFAGRGPDILTTQQAIDDLKNKRVNITTWWKRHHGGNTAKVNKALKELAKKGFVFDEQYFAHMMAKQSPYGI